MITETDVSDEVRALAKRFYLAYTANSGNKNFQGNDCPTWDDLPPAVRGHWCAVAWEEFLRDQHNTETLKAALDQASRETIAAVMPIGKTPDISDDELRARIAKLAQSSISRPVILDSGRDEAVAKLRAALASVPDTSEVYAAAPGTAAWLTQLLIAADEVVDAR